MGAFVVYIVDFYRFCAFFEVHGFHSLYQSICSTLYPSPYRFCYVSRYLSFYFSPIHLSGPLSLQSCAPVTPFSLSFRISIYISLYLFFSSILPSITLYMPFSIASLNPSLHPSSVPVKSSTPPASYFSHC